MISEKIIQQKAAENKKVISDKKFFESSDFKRYIKDMVNITINKHVERYNRVHRIPLKNNLIIKVMSVYNPMNSDVAYASSQTLGNGKESVTIFLNAGHIMFQEIEDRTILFLIVKGLCAHEISHVLNTDFNILKTLYESITAGNLFPTVIDSLLTKEGVRNKKDLDEFLEESKNRKKVHSTLASLQNICEDGYIENVFTTNNHGTMVEGLYELRDHDYSQMPTLGELEEKVESGLYIYKALTQAYLTYAKYGDFKYEDKEELEGDIVKILSPILSDIQEAVITDDAKKRTGIINHTFIHLWKYAKEYILNKEEEEEEKRGAGGAGEDSDAGIAEDLSDIIGATKDDVTSCESLDMKNDKEGAAKPASGEDKEEETEKPVSGEDKKEGAQKPVSEEENNVEDIIKTKSQEGGRLDNSMDGEVLDNGEGSYEDMDYEGGKYEDAAADIDRMLSEMSMREAEEEFEAERTKELSQEADSINYGDMHRNLQVKMHRMKTVPEELKEQYDQISAPLLVISKRLQKKVSQKLLDKRRGGKESNLYIGHKLEARTLVRKDGRNFYKNKLPNDKQELAVSILIDESGSMSWADRASYARATALIIHDFCKGLKIPVSVHGHTAGFCGDIDLDMYSYAEFDCIDKNDKYRIMDICARQNNRDGAALKYCCEKLMKRHEESKILIVVSDGQPSATGYYGQAAEADMHNIVKKYQKKGISTIAAAIGDDKEDIQRIYGTEGFLDVTDLEKLPVLLTNIIIKNLKI